MSVRELTLNRSTQGCRPTKGLEVEALLTELGQVLDPELDESILDLGFIESLEVDEGVVIVELQLPTSWCALNFAYLMADDIRVRLLTVDGVESVTVRLKDHISSESVESGVNAGKSFAEAFAGEAFDNLEGLRALFSPKRIHQTAGAVPQIVCWRRTSPQRRFVPSMWETSNSTMSPA